MPFNPEPAWIIKRASCNCSQPRAYFRGMGDGRAATRTKPHLQPPAGFIRAMLVLRELSLNELHIPLVKVGYESKRAAESALAESAVANHTYSWLPSHAIS